MDEAKNEELAELTTAPKQKTATPTVNKSDSSIFKRSTSVNDVFRSRTMSLSILTEGTKQIGQNFKGKDYDCCSRLFESKYCNICWGIFAIFIIGVTVMTPIACLIGGYQIQKAFNKYTTDEINESCDGMESSFYYNDINLAGHGQAMFIFGIIDFLFVICQGTTLFFYFYRDNDDLDIDTNVFASMCGIRIFFAIVWIVYASYIFDSYDVLVGFCDTNSGFYKDMMDIFEWLIPILSIEIFKDFIVGVLSCCMCCILCWLV